MLFPVRHYLEIVGKFSVIYLCRLKHQSYVIQLDILYNAEYLIT